MRTDRQTERQTHNRHVDDNKGH